MGLDVFGVDLSAPMVTLARSSHPGLRFEVGTMTALDLPDRTLGGALCRYSLIHTPPADIPARLVSQAGLVEVARLVRAPVEENEAGRHSCWPAVSATDLPESTAGTLPFTGVDHTSPAHSPRHSTTPATASGG
ncbi:hypothetical protein BBK14_10640 [Parafrankia soli]|uniref:Methyltransferase domain-containing protein n=1 Tax=Parafrankia soli TaxID=2599596 RepID=A0A1S1RDY4_9ACTN|nr:hypothetical protein BBK14_10640 [Parafrankia soli]